MGVLNVQVGKGKRDAEPERKKGQFEVFHKTLAANVCTGTRVVRGVKISIVIRVQLSLALESLQLRRPSYIRVGDYSNIKATFIGSQRPQPSLHAMMQTPWYVYLSKNSFERFLLHLSQKNPNSN